MYNGTENMLRRTNRPGAATRGKHLPEAQSPEHGSGP